MARSVFFSFHYERDIWRANQVRQHWVTKKSYTLAGYWDHSLWETTKLLGDAAIKRLIASGLKGTTVTVVLIGAETASRRWVTYEIDESVKRGNGFVGVDLKNLRDRDGCYDYPGSSPLDLVQAQDAMGYRRPLSFWYQTYDWVDNNGYLNFGDWIEEAAETAGR